MDKSTLTAQANSVFDYMFKFYREISFLIKEIEGILAREPEHFQIGKPRGYQISAPISWGLETPEFWWFRKFAVFFAPEGRIHPLGGKTKTAFMPDLKILYLMFILAEKNLGSPKIGVGIQCELESKSTESYAKVEDTIANYLEKNWELALSSGPLVEVAFEDKWFKFKSRYKTNNLLDINIPDDILEFLNPILSEYRNL
jgi:hypothetical protein